MDVLILAFSQGLEPLIGISLNALSDVVNFFPRYCLVGFLVNFFDNLWVRNLLYRQSSDNILYQDFFAICELRHLLFTHFWKIKLCPCGVSERFDIIPGIFQCVYYEIFEFFIRVPCTLPTFQYYSVKPTSRWMHGYISSTFNAYLINFCDSLIATHNDNYNILNIYLQKKPIMCIKLLISQNRPFILVSSGSGLLDNKVLRYNLSPCIKSTRLGLVFFCSISLVSCL